MITGPCYINWRNVAACVYSCSKVMGFFFKHKISDTYTLSIDLKNNKHKYEMFCDIYARFDKKIS